MKEDVSVVVHGEGVSIHSQLKKSSHLTVQYFKTPSDYLGVPGKEVSTSRFPE